MPMMIAASLFKVCTTAIERNILINRESSSDKEFHFQNWIKHRIADTGLNFDAPGRNSFPDFFMVDSPFGFEVKGLAYPGREKNYDGNSQIPKGTHNSRSIYYIFGRYPSKPDGNSYPVLDLVICAGSFLNADSNYVHENKNVKGLGSYGDIMIRDRKMYVIPTPYSIALGLAHNKTLILPADIVLDDEFEVVGNLCRKEAPELLTGYSFDLITNNIISSRIANPNAGREHHFKAWRLGRHPMADVRMRSIKEIVAEVEDAANLENNMEENE